MACKKGCWTKFFDVSFLLCTVWKVHSVWAEHCMPVVMMFEDRGSAKPLEAVCKIVDRCWGCVWDKSVVPMCWVGCRRGVW